MENNTITAKVTTDRQPVLSALVWCRGSLNLLKFLFVVIMVSLLLISLLLQYSGLTHVALKRNLSNVSVNGYHTNVALKSNIPNFSVNGNHIVPPNDYASVAAICAIQRDGLLYVDEWIDYHIALGFETIFIYDNSDDFELRGWYSNRFKQNTKLIKIVHWVGSGEQLAAYNNCTKEIQQRKSHSWIAFIDLDEFIVIKDIQKFPHIMDLLDTIPKEASGLTANWQVFTWNNHTKYEPKPLSLRFDHFRKNKHVKTIARADRIKLFPNPHFAIYYTHKAVDSNGDIVDGPFNERMPLDVLAVNHYTAKSLEEYKLRCKRGRATVAEVQTSATYFPCTSEENILATWMKIDHSKTSFDDSVWKLLKERVPVYKKKFDYKERRVR